jgi:hypothetical protein
MEVMKIQILNDSHPGLKQHYFFSPGLQHRKIASWKRKNLNNNNGNGGEEKVFLIHFCPPHHALSFMLLTFRSIIPFKFFCCYCYNIRMERERENFSRHQWGGDTVRRWCRKRKRGMNSQYASISERALTVFRFLFYSTKSYVACIDDFLIAISLK